MIKPTSNPEVKRIAEKASSDTGVFPTHLTFPHLRQINKDVDRVIAIAIGSISYI